MRKAQSLIVQFIIFFVMGFSLFVTIGTLFRIQSDTFRNDAANYSLGLTGSYFSSAMVSAIDTCKQCDYARYSLKIENMTAGFFLEVGLDSQEGLKVAAVPAGKSSASYVHNFNESFDLSGSASSARPITLTFSRTKNELRVE